MAGDSMNSAKPIEIPKSQNPLDSAVTNLVNGKDRDPLFYGLGSALIMGGFFFPGTIGLALNAAGFGVIGGRMVYNNMLKRSDN